VATLMLKCRPERPPQCDVWKGELTREAGGFPKISLIAPPELVEELDPEGVYRVTPPAANRTRCQRLLRSPLALPPQTQIRCYAQIDNSLRPRRSAAGLRL
jgi:hypothetical protein